MRMHHIGIDSSDLARSLAFYQDIIGFDLVERMELMGEELVFLQLGSTRLELIVTKEGHIRANSHIHLAFEVDSLFQIMEQLVRKDIKILEGPQTLENGWRNLFVQGPDGEWIEFIELEN
ncbi:VOC family protein [Paenibacillus albiflavus]|uniref:VOC family protein n=1 Tax=Paenibacillus albiflavus TaxID=2545760 RepID=A0A4R4E0G4_9BACL|nr:VOC family protein [Paenibacillus albiflavus]TCZ70946.1 VOC family protein [Paenibacillus albiflavus]